MRRRSEALALVKPPEESGVHPIVYTQADLDAARDAIIAASHGVALNTWRLGRELVRVDRLGLWQLRRGEDGVPAHKSFAAFLRTECRLKKVMASYAMRVAAKYSEADVLRFGVTKLALLEEAPAEDRPALRQRLEGGASKREVEREVRRLNAQKRPRQDGGVRRRSEVKRPNPANPVQVEAPPAPQPPPPQDQVVTIALHKRTSVSMFRGVKDQPRQRAKSMDDRPFARIAGLNEGVTLWLMVKQDEGGLYVVVEAEREEPTP
jgi:hypothetical protein